MEDFSPETRNALKQLEALSGKPVRLMRDDNASIIAVLRVARGGATHHTLVHQPLGGAQLDYFVAFHALHAARFFAVPAARRHDLGQAELKQPNPLADLLEMAKTDADRKGAWELAEHFQHWALMNLRTIPTGMRADQTIRQDFPALQALQEAGIDQVQHDNMRVLDFKRGNLHIPPRLLGLYAASALFSDRLLGRKLYSIPFEAMGVLDLGIELLAAYDSIEAGPENDEALVDEWARIIGMTGAYRWVPYVA